jgi:biotin synthase-like enzyme
LGGDVTLPAQSEKWQALTEKALNNEAMTNQEATAGQEYRDDYRMIEDLGFEIEASALAGECR